MNRTALITGGAGFIGSHLADRLLADGWRVIAVDNFAIGRRENIAHLAGEPGFSFVEADILDRVALMRIAADAKVGAVFHLAAVHYIPFCEANPFEAMRINILGTQAAIDAAVAASASRIVLTSTSDVYATKDEPFDETDAVDPYTVYGTTKMVAERLCRLATTTHPGLSAAVARLFNVYGPRETNPHVLPEILQQLKAGSVIKLGNLWPRRDFVYVTDVADALVALLRSPAQFDVFNVGSGRATTIGDAANIIARLSMRPMTVAGDPERTRAVERMSLHANVAKIERALGWRPARSFADGMTRWLIAEGLLDEIPSRGV